MKNDWTSIRIKKDTAERLRSIGSKNYDITIRHLLDGHIITENGKRYVLIE